MGGLGAGLAHVLLAADHLAAVAPFAIEARRRAWRVGLRWGFGHAAGVVVVAGLAWGGLDRLDLEGWERMGGYLAGTVLLAIGAWGFVHAHRFQLQPGESASRAGHVHTGASFLVGLVHGVGGTASLLGVLPALGFASGWMASGYLAGFGAGTIGGMVALAAVLGLWVSVERAESLLRRLFMGASALCLALGAFWIYLASRGADLH